MKTNENSSIGVFERFFDRAAKRIRDGKDPGYMREIAFPLREECGGVSSPRSGGQELIG